MTDLKALEKVREHVSWISDLYQQQSMTTFPIPMRAAEAKAILDQLIEREKDTKSQVCKKPEEQCIQSEIPLLETKFALNAAMRVRAMEPVLSKQVALSGVDGSLTACQDDGAHAPFDSEAPATQQPDYSTGSDLKWEDVHLRVCHDDLYKGPGHRCISYKGVVYKPEQEAIDEALLRELETLVNSPTNRWVWLEEVIAIVNKHLGRKA